MYHVTMKELSYLWVDFGLCYSYSSPVCKVKKNEIGCSERDRIEVIHPKQTQTKKVIDRKFIRTSDLQTRTLNI